jgi:hypothetical protein
LIFKEQKLLEEIYSKNTISIKAIFYNLNNAINSLVISAIVYWYLYTLIKNIPNTPTMEEANSMHEVMDFNKDKKVTVADF